jgi:isoamylase
MLHTENVDHDLMAFVKNIAALRRDHAVFRKRQFAFDEISWYRNDGKRMSATDCYTPWAKAIGMFIESSTMDQLDKGFYVAFNSHSQRIPFTIPRRTRARLARGR